MVKPFSVKGKWRDGFRRLKHFNKSFLIGKQLWHLLNNESCLTARVLKAKSSFFTFGGKKALYTELYMDKYLVCKRYCSGRIIMADRGNGLFLRAWTDSWVPNTLAERVEAKSNMTCDPNSLVADFID